MLSGLQMYVYIYIERVGERREGKRERGGEGLCPNGLFKNHFGAEVVHNFQYLAASGN